MNGRWQFELQNRFSPERFTGHFPNTPRHRLNQEPKEREERHTFSPDPLHVLPQKWGHSLKPPSYACCIAVNRCDQLPEMLVHVNSQVLGFPSTFSIHTSMIFLILY